MNAERLLEHFDRISDAADAVPRLRRFVLDLAVQGRLLRPEGASGPNRLRAKACSFHAQAVWQIPSHWVFVEVHQLAGSSGLFIDGDWVESKDQDPAGTIRLTQLADVGVGTFRDRSARFMNEETAVRLGCTFLAPGDVLIARMPDPLGRACIFPGDERRCVTVVDVAILRPERDAIDPVFVVHAINSRLFAKNVAAKAAGTTRSRISRGNLAKLPFPLPPLAEQRRIVAKVDELMALCDRLEAAQGEREARRDRLVSASLARVTEAESDDATSRTTSARFHLDHFARLTTRPEHVKQLRQTILNLAVRGRLVQQDPAETAHAVQSTAEVSGDTEKRLDAALPIGWKWVRVRDVAEARLGKMLDKAKNRGRQYPYLRNTNVHWFDVRLDEIKTMPLADDEVESFLLNEGDVLICEGGHGIARTAVWRGEVLGMAFQKALHRVRPGKSLNGEFFSFCISVYYQANILQRLFTGVGIPHFTGAALSKLVFPLPPVAEQRRIVAKVAKLMALCDQLEASLASTASERARLLEALLHEALARAG